MENSNEDQSNAGKTQQHWNASTPGPQPLRRPNAGLNVNAKEWYPSRQPTNNTNNTTRYSAQDRLNKYKVNPSPNVIEQQRKPADFNKLLELIVGVTYDPGQFEDMIDPFFNVTQHYFNDAASLRSIAEMIFKHALDEASFRYNGARLCAAIEEHCETFKSHVQNICEEEVKKNPNRPGLTLCLAELFTQSQCDGKQLYTTLNSLLLSGGNENVKTVCQTLKLSGGSLEEEDKEKMDSIFKELQTLKTSVSSNIVNLIESVNTLREKNWGKDISIAGSSSSEQNGCNWSWIPPIVEKPTFYGPDGVELSMEEQKFLANQCGDRNFYDEDLDDPDELCDPEPEMDEEIQAAFREFVKLNK